MVKPKNTKTLGTFPPIDKGPYTTNSVPPKPKLKAKNKITVNRYFPHCFRVEMRSNAKTHMNAPIAIFAKVPKASGMCNNGKTAANTAPKHADKLNFQPFTFTRAALNANQSNVKSYRKFSIKTYSI
jgi:hypothetical protein